jgi:hypothetical protein
VVEGNQLGTHAPVARRQSQQPLGFLLVKSPKLTGTSNHTLISLASRVLWLDRASSILSDLH